jgi:putative membrane protein
MQIKLAATALALALSGVAAPSLAQTPPPPPPAEAKTSAMPYVMAAGMSDQFEIQSSQIAVQKSPNAATRRFAEMLIRHHTKTTAATMKAATKARLTPPAPTLDPGAAPSIAELNAAAPADFDRVYFAQQVPAHQAALDLHSSYAATGDQKPLRASAKAAVPIVRQHLTAAQKMMAGGSMGRMSGM